MSPLYRIKRWADIFENSETRKLRKLDRLQIPVDFCSKGYCLLMAEADGASLYGCWLALCGLATRGAPRGSLTDSDGSPHTPTTAALITRLPVSILTRAWDVLADPRIGWLVLVSAITPQLPPSQNDTARTADDLPTPPRVPGESPGVPGIA